jgi:hypothetical protein
MQHGLRVGLTQPETLSLSKGFGKNCSLPPPLAARLTGIFHIMQRGLRVKRGDFVTDGGVAPRPSAWPAWVLQIGRIVLTGTAATFGKVSCFAPLPATAHASHGRRGRRANSRRGKRKPHPWERPSPNRWISPRMADGGWQPDDIGPAILTRTWTREGYQRPVEGAESGHLSSLPCLLTTAIGKMFQPQLARPPTTGPRSAPSKPDGTWFPRSGASQLVRGV